MPDKTFTVEVTDKLFDADKKLENVHYESTGDLDGEDGDGNLDFLISVSDFTNNAVLNPDFTVTGDGIFDKIMETANKHIQAQFDAGRIRKEDYATAYISVFNTALSGALKMLLEKDYQIQLTLNARAQRELIKNQILSEASQRLLLKQQLKTEKNRTVLIANQANVEYDNLHTAFVQRQLIQEQTKTEKKKTVLVGNQAISEADSLLTASAQRRLIQEQTNTEAKKTILVGNQAISEEDSLLTAEKQRDMLDKQMETEVSKKELYDRQRKGFSENYKISVIKQILDTWSIFYTVAATDKNTNIPVNVTSQETLDNAIAIIAKDAGFEGSSMNWNTTAVEDE
jgi:hypothetical protein